MLHKTKWDFRTWADRREAVRAGKTMPIGGAGVPLAGGLLCVTSHARQEDKQGSRVNSSCRNYEDKDGENLVRRKNLLSCIFVMPIPKGGGMWNVNVFSTLRSLSFFCLFLSFISCYSVLHFPSSIGFWYIFILIVNMTKFLSPSLASSASRPFLWMWAFLKWNVVYPMIVSSAR